jgi:hypothetical protein
MAKRKQGDTDEARIATLAELAVKFRTYYTVMVEDGFDAEELDTAISKVEAEIEPDLEARLLKQIEDDEEASDDDEAEDKPADKKSKADTKGESEADYRARLQKDELKRGMARRGSSAKIRF